MKTAVLLFSSGLSLISSSFAIDIPGGLKDEIPRLVDSDHYQIAGINVRKKNFLRHAAQKYGSTAEKRGPTHRTKSICYEDESNIRLVLQTTAVGFGYSLGKHLDGNIAKEFDVECKLIDLHFKKSNDFGLALGQSRAEVINLLGTPVADFKDNLVYRYWVVKKIEDRDFDIYSSISVFFRDDEVYLFSVYTTETN